MSKFQIILLVIFGFFILVAVAVFALYRGGPSSQSVAVTLWGDISSYYFNQWLNNSGINQDRTLSISYVEKSPETISREFTESLAEGGGPDIIIITQENLWKDKAKLILIPHANISERDFKQTFIEEGELFLDASGAYALPLVADPLVLYYNRDILSAAGIAKPIAFWDEIYAAASKLNKKDTALNITQSVMALGEARNIPNAKEILSLLFLQAGTPIVGSPDSFSHRAMLTDTFGRSTSPAESALEFYTQFSNPTKSFYSWNRSNLSAQTHFTSGASAYYLGTASEEKILRNKNPNLNLAVTLAPQSRTSGKAITFARLQGIAISRSTKNPGGAFAVATKLVSKDSVKALSEVLGLPPARRDLLSLMPTGAHESVFYDAALQSKGWLDPEPLETKNIFKEMIESVTSGRARTTEAVGEADRKINALIK